MIEHGLDAVLVNASFLHVFGLRCSACTARELWRHLWQVVEEENNFPEEVGAVMEVVLKEGNLAERISRALGPEPGAGDITGVYRQLATCLAGGTMFLPG